MTYIAEIKRTDLGKTYILEHRIAKIYAVMVDVGYDCIELYEGTLEQCRNYIDSVVALERNEMHNV